MFSKKWLFIGCLSLSPLYAAASECDRVANTIHDFSTESASERAQEHPKWMDLTWLKRNLGTPKKEAMDSRIIYKWVCSEDGGGYISLVTDMQGATISVSGVYNSDAGSGMFYTPLRKTPPSVAPENPVPAVKSKGSITQSNMVVAKPVIAPTASCSTILKQINADNIQYRFGLKDQHLPWMNINWVKQQLGAPTTSPITETFYQWDNYAVYNDGSGFFVSQGILPNESKLAAHSVLSGTDKLAAAYKVFGQPKQMVIDHLTENKWRCDNGSSLSLITDKEQVLIKVIGDCKDQRCESFRLALTGGLAYHAFQQRMQLRTASNAASTISIPAHNNVPDQQAAIPTIPQSVQVAPQIQPDMPATAPAQITILPHEQTAPVASQVEMPVPPIPKASIKKQMPTPTQVMAAIKDFNNHYKSFVKTPDTLITAMGDQMANYYKNVRECTPGSYDFAKFLPDTLVFPKVNVAGMMDGTCLIEITYQSKGNVDIKCEFPPETLALFTEDQAKQDAADSGSESFSPALEKATENQCVKTVIPQA